MLARDFAFAGGFVLDGDDFVEASFRGRFVFDGDEDFCQTALRGRFVSGDTGCWTLRVIAGAALCEGARVQCVGGDSWGEVP